MKSFFYFVKWGLLKIHTAQQHRQINAADARRQGEPLYLILRATGKEADVVISENEKTGIINNLLCARIDQLARNS